MGHTKYSLPEEQRKDMQSEGGGKAMTDQQLNERLAKALGCLEADNG